jgi:hypothetical protein
MATINLNINGKKQTVDANAKTLVLWVLRDHLNLVGKTAARYSLYLLPLTVSVLLTFATGNGTFKNYPVMKKGV